jgi:hypothetical protein
LNYFSAAKVGKKIEIDVSLLEKVVSNQEKIIKNLAIIIYSFYLCPQN